MSLLSDLRSAARSLGRIPTVTISAVLCLTLGIGATTAVSSALNRALFQPPPVRDPAHLVAVHRITPHSGPQGTWPQSVANYVDLANASQRIQGLAAFGFGSALVRPRDVSFQASLLRVTGNLFSTLGVGASLGRLITPDDDALDRPPVAVVSDDFWSTRLGGDPSLIGREIAIDGTPTTIIGVLPHDFRIPHGTSVVQADIWVPIRFTPAQMGQRRNNFLKMLGRLAPGETPQTAEAEMKSLFANLVSTYPELTGENLRVAPLQAENAAAVRKPLVMLFGAVLMVLLISAINVAALLLARGVSRRKEMAVRTALGASRWKVIQPVLLESAIITALGVVGGLALATAGVKTIGNLAAARMQQLVGLTIDGRVILFALVLAIVVAVVCAAVPAWRSANVPPQDALSGGRGAGAGREHRRALSGLVVVEIAMSLVLLIGTALVLKGFASLLRNDPGFDAAHVLTLRAIVPTTNYADGSTVRAFLEPSLDAVRQIPGVEAASAISAVPYITWGNNFNVIYEGHSGDAPSTLPIVENRTVTPEFFAVTRQRLLAGRLLQASDDESPNAPIVVVVNQALAERDFRDRDPIGQRFHLSDTVFGTIVGVVSNIRNAGPLSEPVPEMYWSWRQVGGGATSFPIVVRVRGDDPSAVVAQVERAIRSVDPQAAVANMQPMTDAISRSLGQPRFYFSLLGAFAASALVLSLAGLYGVLSYAVAQRTREIGIRAALGSPRSALMRLVTFEGLRLVGLGLVLGLAGGAAVTRLMVFMLYGVSPLDSAAWTVAVVLMVLAGLLAAVIPALRAARVNPIVAIQTE